MVCTKAGMPVKSSLEFYFLCTMQIPCNFNTKHPVLTIRSSRTRGRKLRNFKCRVHQLFYLMFTSDLSFIKFPNKAEPAPMRPVSSTMCKWSSWYWSHPWNWRNGNLVVTFVKIQRQTTAFDILCVLQQLVKPWGFHGFPHGCHAQPRPAATDLPAAGRCSMYIPGSVVRDCISRASK